MAQARLVRQSLQFRPEIDRRVGEGRGIAEASNWARDPFWAVRPVTRNR
jgi:hypothetical protein